MVLEAGREAECQESWRPGARMVQKITEGRVGGEKRRQAEIQIVDSNRHAANWQVGQQVAGGGMQDPGRIEFERAIQHPDLC